MTTLLHHVLLNTDTDIGSDVDDARALGVLLGPPADERGVPARVIKQIG
ncbi:hypothetical protein [Streptomyces sp. MH60]|nr:hypothetical protein [Streptomyces sp. MH60]PPS91046.1 hypothetical protein BZZ08_00645 [Streptomyces sp. MH60]